MKEMYEMLCNRTDDAEVKIVTLNPNKVIIAIKLPSRGNEIWTLRSSSPIHIDMNPSLELGHMEFGDVSLLPTGYLDRRNFDYGGRIEDYRVICFYDVDGKEHFLIIYGEEEIVI
ncbi:MAG: hypothetical protein GY832_04165 [Chloroflexi bacterium]|nr:hypothetical protein [Chloroflexota bacterium]